MDWIYKKNPLIIYIADPMCSWCYGFAPVIDQVRKDLPDLEFKLILGGLRPGGTDTISEMDEFLTHHWKEVAKRSGQPFNYEAFDYPDRILDTEPGSRAVITARKMNVKDEYEFFKSVQSAFFNHAKDMTSTETFVEIAEQFNLDTNEFKEQFESDELKYETRSDFQLSSEMGIKGFPSVVVRHNGELFLAANGYRTHEDLSMVINKIRST